MSTRNFTGSDKAAAALGGLLIAAVMAFAVTKEMGMIDNLLAKRGVGLALGGLLIVAGNLLPKLVLPLGARGGNPRTAAAERFAGMVFVLAGLAQMAAWIFAPLNAPLMAALIGLTAVVLAVGNYLRLAMTAPGQASSGPLSDTRSSRAILGKRGVVFHILHALAWVFAMFLADEIWGDSVVQWMTVGFVLSQGAMITIMAIRQRQLQNPRC